MIDIFKMDELLATHQQNRALATAMPAMRPARDLQKFRRALIGLSVVLYASLAIGVVGYAFWAASHLGK